MVTIPNKLRKFNATLYIKKKKNTFLFIHVYDVKIEDISSEKGNKLLNKKKIFFTVLSFCCELIIGY